MNGIMLTLVIVFLLDLLGSYMLTKMELKRELETERRLEEIKELLLSSPQYSPFPEFETKDKTSLEQ